MLQRWAYSCGYAPDLLTSAGQQTDRLEAFKYVVSYYFTCHHLGIAQIKPFNPILGETYQGFLNGIPLACEQISHHPPISAIHMKTDDFFLHGTQQMDASLGPNSATAQDKRRVCVTLPKLDMNIYVNFPVCLVSGTAFGKRYFNWSKKLRVYDPKHLLYAEITFNPDEKGMISGLFAKKNTEADKCRGAIYKVKPEFMEVMHTKEGVKNNNPKAKFNPKEHSVEELGTVEGSWTSHIEFDGKRLWDNETMKPYKLIDMPNKALPSDSGLREDLIYKRMNNDPQAQILKDKLENLQRADRKLREKKNPKGKH